MKFKKFLMVLPVLTLSALISFAQTNKYGNPANKKVGVHSGNQVKTVFSNAGVIAQPSTGGPRGAWIYDNNGYIGDISLMVGVESAMGPNADYSNALINKLINSNKDSIFHSVVISDVARPAVAQEEDLAGNRMCFQPKGEFAAAGQKSIALSTNPATWPSRWPDKESDPTDPGWVGSWNGYFGKTPKSDQESYFVMDDQVDHEFNDAPFNYKTLQSDASRKGMGLSVKVRGLQWAQFLAQDCIFWLYEIENFSDNDFNKAVFGLICGTYVGVTGTDDSPQEYNDDASFFDVEYNLVYSWDYPQNNSRNPNWVGKSVGYVGYAFLESPGNQFDGIDNDRDSKLTTTYFTPDDFDTLKGVVLPGSTLITIRRVSVPSGTGTRIIYVRDAVTVPNTPFELQTLGMKKPVTITPGVTVLMEGNVVKKFVPASTGVPAHYEDVINPNALDGIDNDFDGLIDENYFVHYRQYKIDQNGKVLFDKIVPAAYTNYKGYVGLNGDTPDPMIDEGRDDGVDNDGDWDPLNDDVGADGIAETADLGENDGLKTPGEPNFDATDVDESDQIGLTSFNYFQPSNAINLKDDELLWANLSPGLFSTPNNIENGKALFGDDGDFTFGSGYFPLLSKTTERFSFALLYGHDLKHFYKNRRVVQNIYNNNYRFPQPPARPVLKAVSGDKRVTLYWGRVSEESVDPVLKDENGRPVKDFEGYKIYKALDYNFEEIHTLTDGDGQKVGYKPLAQFDIPGNNVLGYFESKSDIFQTSSGYTFYLGDDQVGLAHKYVDEDVTNGVTYYYAVTAYDRGVDTLGILPSECTMIILKDQYGNLSPDPNCAVVVPGAPVAGYSVTSNFEITHKSGSSNSQVGATVVDPKRLADNRLFEVSFQDQSSDGIDNDGDGKSDLNDYDEYLPLTTNYSVKNTTGVVETFTADGSNKYFFASKPAYVIPSEVVVKKVDGSVLDQSQYRVDPNNGFIGSKIGMDSPFTEGSIFTVEYKPYTIYKSPYIPNNPLKQETANRPESDDISFDGVQLNMANSWSFGKIDSSIGFSGDTTSMVMRPSSLEILNKSKLIGLVYTPLPYDYEIETSSDFIGKGVVDDYLKNIFLGTKVDSLPLKFKVKNLTTGKDAKFVYFPKNRGSNVLTNGDAIIVLESIPQKNYNATEPRTVAGETANYKIYRCSKDSSFIYGYLIEFSSKYPVTSIERPMKFKFSAYKPFSAQDKYQFTTFAPKVESAEEAKADMLNIRVVPNPYVAYNSMESPLPPLITSGRGERRIEFRGVPNDATVYIFTSAGDLIRTLYAEGTVHNGTIKWDLKTKENLDVAAGMYFYILESKYGKKEGKIGIIK